MNEPRPKVALSTTSVFPENTEAGFRLGKALGYDGIEVMVSGLDSMCTDPDALERLRDTYQIPVLAIHAPTLLVTQRTWGSDPWEKLERSARAAQQLGADSVVLHPPFRWQGKYGRSFVDGIRSLNERHDVRFCVENMFPWRTPRGEFKAYLPGWDPSELDYEWLTLDLSHASTAHQDSLDLAKAWGDRLAHVHLTDGKGAVSDEHLLPGYGDQHAAEVLDHLRQTGFSGHVVVEVNTRKSGSKHQREQDLAECLDFARRHLGQAGA